MTPKSKNKTSEPKLRTKVSKKSKENKKTFNFCDDKYFSETQGVIKFEHCHECPIFYQKAEEIMKFMTEHFPKQNFKFLYNESELDGSKFEPRFGAFEIWFGKNCRMPMHLLWTGIEKGPPRRDKFPITYDSMAKAIQKFIITG